MLFGGRRRIVDNREVSTADVPEEGRIQVRGDVWRPNRDRTLGHARRGESRKWLDAYLASGVGLADRRGFRAGAVAGAPLVFASASSRADGRRRTVALVLVGVITAADAFALVALIASLLSGHEKSGGELLLKGATIWGTNMITVGLLLWEFDRGGPTRRREPDPPPRDFQFPQDENPTLAKPDWHRDWRTMCTSRSPMPLRAALPM